MPYSGLLPLPVYQVDKLFPHFYSYKLLDVILLCFVSSSLEDNVCLLVIYAYIPMAHMNEVLNSV